jgi:flap endonuclease-1
MRIIEYIYLMLHQNPHSKLSVFKVKWCLSKACSGLKKKLGVDIRGIIRPTRLSLEQLGGRTLAIDAYNALYQFLAIIRGERGEYLMDHEGRVTSHLSGLFYRNVNLLELGIRPIYILDGKAPSLKEKEIERRRTAKREALNRYNLALARGDLTEARKQASATTFIKDYMIYDAKRMLDAMGIPWIEAPSEGEATAAYLTKRGVATDAASQDYDALLFGAVRLVRNVTISGKRRLPSRGVYVTVEPEEIILKQVLESLEVTQEQLIDIGILVGTDFNPGGFSRFGPLTALKYVKKYGCLEDIDKIHGELKSIDYKEIREIFLNPSVTMPRKELEWDSPNLDGIIDFLCGERDFSKERVTRALERMNKIERQRSESLEKWFG